MEFDENKAIEHIRYFIGKERSDKYDDDQLLNVIDLIWDFYEENGLLEIDTDEEISEEDVLDDLIIYAKRMLAKDKGASIDGFDIEDIIRGEIDYENSLNEF